MLVDVATWKNGIYSNRFRFDSEQHSKATHPDLPLSASINKMI